MISVIIISITLSIIILSIIIISISSSIILLPFNMMNMDRGETYVMIIWIEQRVCFFIILSERK